MEMHKLKALLKNMILWIRIKSQFQFWFLKIVIFEKFQSFEKSLYMSHSINYLSRYNFRRITKSEKINITLTNMVSLTFLLGIMADSLPRTKSLPRLGIARFRWYLLLFVYISALFAIVNFCLMCLAVSVSLSAPYISKFSLWCYRTSKSRTNSTVEFKEIELTDRILENRSVKYRILFEINLYLALDNRWFSSNFV